MAKYRPDNMMLTKIITGGQSGVDRACMDAAIATKTPYGGYCPKGRLAEDGRIDKKYSLRELSSSDYESRTKKNIEISDATLIIYVEELDKGTEYCLQECKASKKECLLTRPEMNEIPGIIQWIKSERITVINIAGPRESSAPGIYKSAYSFLHQLFMEFRHKLHE